jgi:hypothetical protein
MKKIILVLLFGAFFTVTASAQAATTPTPPAKISATNAPTPPKRPTIPFIGSVQKVDKVASTITLNGKNGGRVFHLLPTSKILRAGQPATLADAKIGEEVAGAYREENEKKIAVSLRLGPKPATTKAK